MNGIWKPGKPGIILVLFLFSMTWAGTQEAHAALLDGLLDGVEESLGLKGCRKKEKN